ncbi:MAG: hypothetical protein WA252_12600 [Candidatus Sulfotelmatobacter sp.]
MTELETQFDEAVMKAVQEGARLGYSASDYLSKRRVEGPMALALRLIKDKQPSYGLRKLWAMKRLDLSIEAIVWDNPRFQALFPPKVVERCRGKLEALDYFKPKRILPPLRKMDWNRR